MSTQAPPPTAVAQQPLTSADFEKVASVETNFTPLKKVDDPRYGNVTIIQIPGNQRKLMCKEKVFSSKKELEQEIYAVKKRIAVGNSNLLHLIDYSTGSRSDFCSSFYWIKLYFEYPDHDLQQELRRRAKFNLVGLNADELTHMLYQISDGGAFLNSHGLVHGDICPETIEMDSPERFRLVEKFGDMSRPDMIQHTRHWAGAQTYPAPEVYNKIRAGNYKAPKGDFVATADHMKADVFSLGMTMLFAGTGENASGIYNKKGPATNIEVLERIFRDYKGGRNQIYPVDFFLFQQHAD